MRKKLNNLKIAVLVLVVLLITGCQYSYTRLEFERGRQAVEQKDYKQAITHFSRVISRNPDSNISIVSAIKAAQLSQREIKDYKKSVYFYKYIVRHSKDQNVVLSAQEKISHLYFENIGDYKKAIDEFSKLTNLTQKNTKIYTSAKFKVAKSYFYLNNFFQAKSEVEDLIKQDNEHKDIFELKQFLANIFFTTKKLEEAITTYKDLEKEFPERARDENVPMSIVVCYEELKQFDNAIKKLQTMKSTYPTPEFIDFKINRLKERKQNLPRR